MKRSKKEVGSRRLVDRIVPAAHVGPLRGFLATTFDLTPDFFESDLLPSMLGMGAWDDRRYSSRIAMERALAQTDAVTMFMDARRYQGRPRSLRVELIGCAKQTLHAKVVLIVHDAAVRLIVTSANVTEAGYRLNREVAVVLTASQSDPTQGALIRSALDPMPALLSAFWSAGAAKIRDLALEKLDAWGAPQSSEDEAFVWGGGQTPLFQTVLQHWPRNELIEQITIVSPFWSEERDGGPIARLNRELLSRKIRGDSLKLQLLTTAVRESQTTFRPVLPESFKAFDARKLGMDATACGVNPRVDKEDLGRDDVLRERELHAKVVLFRGSKTTLAIVGSANFTASGWGFLRNTSVANIEAGLVLRRKGKDRAQLEALVPKTAGDPVALTGAVGASIVLPTPPKEVAPWPVFVKTVCLSPEPLHPDRLGLRIIVEPQAIDGDWQVTLPEGDVVLVDCPNKEPSSEYRVCLTEESLRVLLRKQAVVVKYWGGEVQFPLNVELEARPSLPLSPGDGRPDEKALLAYYQGRIEWEELFPDEAEDAIDCLDKHTTAADASEVDTSNIQSYQIREFVEALRGIRDDVRACPVSEAAMRLALLGPVSPVALGREVLRAVREKKRSAVAGGFQLVELLTLLDEAKGFDVNEPLRKAWHAQLREASTTIDGLLSEIRQSHAEALRHSSFVAYERAARAKGKER